MYHAYLQLRSIPSTSDMGQSQDEAGQTIWNIAIVLKVLNDLKQAQDAALVATKAQSRRSG